MCQNFQLIRKDGRANNGFPPIMMFALDLHLTKITNVAKITTIIFNLLSHCLSLVS